MRWAILRPDAAVRKYWDAVMFVVIFYNCNMTPILVATPPRSVTVRSKLRAIDFVMDILFVVDTMAGFCFAFHDKDTKELVIHPKAIRDSYLASARFKLNLLAITPLFTLPNFINKHLGHGLCKYCLGGSQRRFQRESCQKVARLTRLSRIFVFFSQLDAVRAVLSRAGIVTLNEPGFRMCQIAVSYLFLASFCGSLYFYLACNDPHSCFQHSSRHTWVHADVVFNEAGDNSWVVILSRCVYFMVQTLFTIGYGDSVAPVSNAEIGLTLALMLLGAFTYALVIANATSMLANANVLYVRHQEEVATISQIMAERDVPEGLKSRVKQCFDYLWSKQGGMLDEALLCEIPTRLRRQVERRRFDFLARVPFFASAKADVKEAAARALEKRIYVPNSTIVYAHEKQSELFVVTRGKLRLYSMKSPLALATLREGDYFGDFQLVLDARHPVFARTDTRFVECLVLTRAKFEIICTHFALGLTEHDAGVQATIEAYKHKLYNWRLATDSMAAACDGDDDEDTVAEDDDEDAAVSPQDIIDAQERFVIFPDSRFRVVWDTALFASSCASFVAVPLRTAWYAGYYYRARRCGPDPTLWIDWCFDVLFVIDFYLRCRHMAYESATTTRMVYKQPDAFQLYASTFRFKLDLIGAAPWSVLAPALAAGSSSSWRISGCMWYAVARYPHLARGGTLASRLAEIRSYFESTGRFVPDGVITVARRTYETVFLLVFLACYWSIIRSHGSGDERQSFSSKVLRALYFAIVTLSTVGYGDVTPETVSETWFVVLAGAIGATFFAGIVANITSFVHSVDISDDNLAHKRLVLHTFLTECGVSSDVQLRVSAYFDFIQHEKGGLDDLQLLDKHLPRNVRDDVVSYLTHRLVLACKLFRGSEASFLRELMLRLDQRFYMRGELVVVQEWPVEGMFFIGKGEVDILIDDDKVACLQANNVFAEAAILHMVDHSYFSARSATYSEQWYLARVKFNSLLPDFPLVEAKLPDMRRRVRIFKPKKPSCSRSSPFTPSFRESSVPPAEIIPIRLPPGFVHPDGVAMRLWNALVLFFDIWNMIFVPYKASFLASNYRIKKMLILLACVDYLGDAVFVADIVVRCRHVVHFESGDVPVTSRRRLYELYRASGRLHRHILASLPLDIFALVGRPRRLFSFVQWLALLRANKLIRFADAPELVVRCEHALVAAGMNVHKNIFRLFRLVIALVVSSHFFGSIFFAIANAQGGPLACNRYRRAKADAYCRNWAQHLLNVKYYPAIGHFPDTLSVLSNATNVTTFASWGTRWPKREVDYDLHSATHLWKQYVTALYWGAATITTVGYGDVSATSLPEVMFSIICLMMSVVVYTLIVANLEDIVGNLDVTTTLYNQKRDQVNQYCLRSYLPESLSVAITDYYDKLWSQQKGVRGSTVLHMVPANVRATIVLELCGSNLQDLVFVSTCGRPALLEDLALSLRLDLYMPQDYLFHSGECASRLFLLCLGQAHILDTDQSCLRVVLPGTTGVIGDAEFFLRVLYPRSCQTVDNSQVFSITFESFECVVDTHGMRTQFRAELVKHEKELQAACLDATPHEAPQSRAVSSLSNRKHNFSKLKLIAQDGSNNNLLLPGGGLIAPNSLIKRLWHALCLGGVAYFLFSVPYEIAFARSYAPHVFSFDIFFMVLYAVDICLNLTIFTVRQQGKLVTEPRAFRKIYVQTNLFGDVLGLAPLSLIVALAAGPSRFDAGRYSPWVTLLRLVQVLRLKQLVLYLHSLLRLLKEHAKINLSGDAVYLGILLALVVILCHWLACLFYWLGRYELMAELGRRHGYRVFAFNRVFKDEARGCARRHHVSAWICANRLPNRSTGGQRWLVSFYWALYTCSTIGYGAVKITSNAERWVCVAAMIVGAVVCDAGITAVLTAVIQSKDHRAGSNRRRSSCATKLMRAATVQAETQRSVSSFFAYCDDELANLDEQQVLDELNTALRNRILYRAAFAKLCDTVMFGGFEAGLVATLVYEMKAVVAVPQERVLQASQPDPSLYIFQSGVAHSVDAAGDSEFVATGAVLSNIEFKQVAKRVGVPTKQLVIAVIAARGLPSSANLAQRIFTGASVCSPYVEVTVVSKTVFGQSVKTCNTKVRKHTTTPFFGERFVVKAYQTTEYASIAALHWRRGLAGILIGQTEIKVKAEENASPRWHAIHAEKSGKCVGEILVQCNYEALDRVSVAKNAELTVIADTFCHLYLLDFASQERLKKYVKGIRLPYAKRLAQADDQAPSPYRLSNDTLAALTDYDDEMSLCATHVNSRGFEAYMSETFAKRATKGSVMQVTSSRRPTESPSHSRINYNLRSKFCRVHPAAFGS